MKKLPTDANTLGDTFREFFSIFSLLWLLPIAFLDLAVPTFLNIFLLYASPFILLGALVYSHIQRKAFLRRLSDEERTAFDRWERTRETPAEKAKAIKTPRGPSYTKSMTMGFRAFARAFCRIESSKDLECAFRAEQEKERVFVASVLAAHRQAALQEKMRREEARQEAVRATAKRLEAYRQACEYVASREREEDEGGSTLPVPHHQSVQPQPQKRKRVSGRTSEFRDFIKKYRRENGEA
jgi:hypothetical protein